MLRNYAFILRFTGIAFSVPVIGLLAAWRLRPSKPGNIRNAIYECGLDTFGETWLQFKVQYYLYALIFVFFDIWPVFLFPW